MKKQNKNIKGPYYDTKDIIEFVIKYIDETSDDYQKSKLNKKQQKLYDNAKEQLK